MTYIDEVKTREKAATKGPLVKFSNGEVYTLFPTGRAGLVAKGMTEVDAEFFRAAREDVPQLVDWVERMKEVLGFYGDGLNWEREHHSTYSDIEDDEGDKARALLAEMETKP